MMKIVIFSTLVLLKKYIIQRYSESRVEKIKATTTRNITVWFRS